MVQERRGNWRSVRGSGPAGRGHARPYPATTPVRCPRAPPAARHLDATRPTGTGVAPRWNPNRTDIRASAASKQDPRPGVTSLGRSRHVKTGRRSCLRAADGRYRTSAAGYQMVCYRIEARVSTVTQTPEWPELDMAWQSVVTWSSCPPLPAPRSSHEDRSCGRRCPSDTCHRWSHPDGHVQRCIGNRCAHRLHRLLADRPRPLTAAVRRTLEG
jgi:hypothetical protein